MPRIIPNKLNCVVVNNLKAYPLPTSNFELTKLHSFLLQKYPLSPFISFINFFFPTVSETTSKFLSKPMATAGAVNRIPVINLSHHHITLQQPKPPQSSLLFLIRILEFYGLDHRKDFKFFTSLVKLC